MVGTDTLITKLTQKLGHFFSFKFVPLLPRVGWCLGSARSEVA